MGKLKVFVYSAEWCTYCGPVKSFLHNYIEQQGLQDRVEVVVMDVDDPAIGQQFVDFGFRSIPITVIGEGNQKEAVIGYNPAKLKEQLMLRLVSPKA